MDIRKRFLKLGLTEEESDYLVKRGRVDYHGLHMLTAADIACAKTLLLLKYSSDPSPTTSEYEHGNNPAKEKGECSNNPNKQPEYKPSNNNSVKEKGECSSKPTKQPEYKPSFNNSVKEKGECSSNPNKQVNKLKLTILPPKPPREIVEGALKDLEPIESILNKFTNRDPTYGVRRVATNVRLTGTDRNIHQGRLAVACSKLDVGLLGGAFLTENEANEVEKDKGHVPVKVRGSFSDREHDMSFGKWYYYSRKGFWYTWTNGWNEFAEENGLLPDDPVTIDAIRCNGVLCFAIHGGRRRS